MRVLRSFAVNGLPAPDEAGFTLVELCAVLATLAILGAVLLPALAGTKVNTQALQCMNNERQITHGWQMYAADNNGLLPHNDYPFLTSYYLASATQKNQLRNWVVGTMASAFDANPAIGQKELKDPNSQLSPYITNASVYHCPADNYIDPNAHTIHPRSYSMNSAVGTIGWTFYANGSPPLGSPVAQGWLGGSSWSAAATGPWLTYGKMSSFTRPGPVNTWIFIEENPYSINDGDFAASAVATPGNTYLIDWPSGLHGAANAISFADGHVVVHRWLDKRTYTPPPPAQPGQGSSTSTHQSPDNQDCFYLSSITSARR
ncbi:MAG TPA: type II secretion system protein [Verrucomicrobiae bacterium]|nr:type II secretion system protein [Verrucomicrobiae bacterium]